MSIYAPTTVAANLQKSLLSGILLLLNLQRSRRHVFKPTVGCIFQAVNLMISTHRRMPMWPLAQMTCIASSIYAWRKMRN
jgi:hypothetical protein